jgi:hypothetical protein
MSTASPHPDLPADEELVAYLDGELPPEACRRIEARLATDVDFRRRLQELDAAWEALDVLPQTTVDDDFARTTIEMVTVAAKRDAGERAAAAKRTRRKRGLLLAVIGIATAAVGFAAFHTLVPDGNQLLLEDLPAITQVDALTQFKDVDFLRRLRQQVAPEDLADDQEALAQEMEQLRAAGSPSWDERRQWIDQLSSDEKADLAAKSGRFRALAPAPAEQQRLKSLAQQISQADDAAGLQRTMLAYGQWLTHRPEWQKAELRQLPIDERLDRVAELVRRENRRAAQQLSADDAARLRKEVLAIAEERKQQFEQFMEQGRKRDSGKPPRQLTSHPGARALWIVYHGLEDEEARDALRERLKSQLSPQAQQHLQSLPGRGRQWQLMQWVRDSLQPKRGPEELEKFFAEKLDKDQRERLLSLPAAEMEVALERMYVGEQLGLLDTQWWGDFGDRGRFDGPPRGPEGRPRDRGRHDGPPPNGPPRGDTDRGPMGPGPPGPLLDGPPPDRQPPPDWQPPSDRRPPPPDHQQEPI